MQSRVDDPNSLENVKRSYAERCLREARHAAFQALSDPDPTGGNRRKAIKLTEEVLAGELSESFLNHFIKNNNLLPLEDFEKEFTSELYKLRGDSQWQRLIANRALEKSCLRILYWFCHPGAGSQFGDEVWQARNSSDQICDHLQRLTIEMRELVSRKIIPASMVAHFVDSVSECYGTLDTEKQFPRLRKRTHLIYATQMLVQKGCPRNKKALIADLLTAASRAHDPLASRITRASVAHWMTRHLSRRKKVNQKRNQ